MKTYVIGGCKLSIIEKICRPYRTCESGTGIYKFDELPVSVVEVIGKRSSYNVFTSNKKLVLELVRKHLGQRRVNLEVRI